MNTRTVLQSMAGQKLGRPVGWDSGRHDVDIYRHALSGPGGSHHDYRVGDVADKDIKAPKDFFIEDTAATEASRKMAIEEVLTVYDHDHHLAATLVQRVQDAFR